MQVELSLDSDYSAWPVSPGYRAADVERRIGEVHYSRRSDFARDRARVVHSGSLRRLAAKTQVLSPTSGLDFARNRLTHSLEVAQVGRELAADLGLDPDLVDAACLSHDLGHPPFGHNGETALNDWAQDVGGFEGNAQTLRVLTRLEPKVVSNDGQNAGLNLTRATLDATCKYPWAAPVSSGHNGQGRQKFGYYPDDFDTFSWLRAGRGDELLCIEAQVMDLADDIAYSVHDFEDAVVAGFIDVTALSARSNHDALIEAMSSWIGDDLNSADLQQAFDRLESSAFWIDHWDGSRAAHARLKNLASQLIGRFAAAATRATRLAYPSQRLARYEASVVIPPEIRAEIAVLKGVTAAFVMTANERRPIYQQQRELLTELADVLLWTAPGNLEVMFAADWNAASGDSDRKRIIVDQVASLTDQSAMAWHDRLVR